MSPPTAAQVLAAMRALCTLQGLRRVHTLRDNTHYFRRRKRGNFTADLENYDSGPMALQNYSQEIPGKDNSPTSLTSQKNYNKVSPTYVGMQQNILSTPQRNNNSAEQSAGITHTTSVKELCSAISPKQVKEANELARVSGKTNKRLCEMGVVTYGHEDSLVVPMMVFTLSNISATLERLTARDVATVDVGFPATPLYKSRLRFCLSAAHSREQLDTCLAAIQEVVEELGLQYSRRR
ncbi:unnamed protein product [Parnassius apollo]|uniref:(apollo) hypothetical protein n=1 Tax=Parnassius apollo TaxID=110799 RepID=A0A8S3XGK0_PARAO|nr:unnamed protein product [Parnassius apollo]